MLNIYFQYSFSIKEGIFACTANNFLIDLRTIRIHYVHLGSRVQVSIQADNECKYYLDIVNNVARILLVS